MKILMYGNPVDGLTFIGPIEPNDPELDQFVDRELRHVDWWYVDVTSLNDAIEHAKEGAL